MPNIVTIDFHGDPLHGIETERGAFVFLRPIVERLGLDWSAQLKRIKRDPTLREGVAIMATTPDLGGKDAVFLRLDLFHGWLFTVDSARVKAPLRDQLVTYQRECYAVLARAFARPDNLPPRQVQEPTESLPYDLARRLVTEARHTFDRQAGRELWFRLGLPVVPAMMAPPRQGSLFTYQAEKR